MALLASQETDGTIMVALPVRFDFKTYEEFHSEVLPRIAHALKPNVCFSFRLTEYIDSAGLGMLLLARERASVRSGQVQLVGVQGRVSEVLRLAHFERLFPIEWAA